MRLSPNSRAVSSSRPAPREKAAAGLRALILLTAFLMAHMEPQSHSGMFDLVIAIGAVYVLATTFLPWCYGSKRRATLVVLAADVALITAVIHSQYGVHSEYYLLYYLPIVDASIRLNFRDAMGACVLSAASYLLVGVLEGAEATVATSVISRVLTFAVSAFVLAAFFVLLARQQQRLDHLNKDYHDAMKAKSEFLSRVSHDFRTPLTAIVGFSQLLYEHESELDNTRKQEYLTVIREQSQHLARMIEDMLDVSRMRDGELSLHREATNLRDAVEAAAATLADSGYGNRVEVSVEPRTSPVWADRTELEQALDRLLHAVLAHCEDSAPVSVEVAPCEDRELVQVSIFAPGMDADSGGFATLAAPAEPEATRGASNGRTLGLTFARTLIELHGGRVWLDDNHHAGTAISFVLPAYRRQEAGPKVLVAAAARPQGGATEGAEADGEGNDSGRRSVRAEAHAGQPDLLG